MAYKNWIKLFLILCLIGVSIMPDTPNNSNTIVSKGAKGSVSFVIPKAPKDVCIATSGCSSKKGSLPNKHDPRFMEKSVQRRLPKPKDI